MPWTMRNYPAAMDRLPAAVRAKAIEIANALLAGHHPEGEAIRMAIAAAKKWARNRPDGEAVDVRRGARAPVASRPRR